MAKHHRLAHPVAAQVEIAVTEPGLLAHVPRERLDLEGRGVGIREQLHLGHLDLDLSGRQVLVDRLGITADDRPPGAQHVLRSEVMTQLECVARLIRVQHELDQPGPIPQVDEDQAAVVAAAVHPSGDAGLGVHPVRQHLTAPAVAVRIRPQSGEFVAHRDGSLSIPDFCGHAGRVHLALLA
jgi:hypothetical protein